MPLCNLATRKQSKANCIDDQIASSKNPTVKPEVTSQVAKRWWLHCINIYIYNLKGTNECASWTAPFPSNIFISLSQLILAVDDLTQCGQATLDDVICILGAAVSACLEQVTPVTWRLSSKHLAKEKWKSETTRFFRDLFGFFSQASWSATSNMRMQRTADLQNLHIAHWVMQTRFLHVTKHLGTAGLTVFRTDRHVSKNLSSTHLRPYAQQRNQAKNVVTPSTMQITNSIPSEVAKVQQNNEKTKWQKPKKKRKKEICKRKVKQKTQDKWKEWNKNNEKQRKKEEKEKIIDLKVKISSI